MFLVSHLSVYFPESFSVSGGRIIDWLSLLVRKNTYSIIHTSKTVEEVTDKTQTHTQVITYAVCTSSAPLIQWHSVY